MIKILMHKTKSIHLGFKVASRQILLIFLAGLLAILTPVAMVNADSYDVQIKELKRQMAIYQDQAATFRSKADTLHNQLNALLAEKALLQKQIDLNTTRLEQLNKQIAETEKRIAYEQQVLGENLVNIYLDSSVTPLEMIASSNSISDYIDKQEYRDTIRQQLQDSIAAVKQLKEDLSKQKLAVQQTLADQKEQHVALVAKEKERAELLAQTRGQEAAYRTLARNRNARIAELRAQQRIANLAAGGSASYGSSCGGGYSGPWPRWCRAPLDSYLDNWGMYSRECVSYAAFKVWQSGRHMPYWGGHGNANQWDDNARASGIPVDGSPKAGDVAVWPIGYYGHVMYVEAVQSDGDILVSEYNYDWTGRYSERLISSGTYRGQGFSFIHF